MRWTYVLRTRERWLGKGAASSMRRMPRTLLDFGVDDAALQRIALASRVVVSMPYVEESDGWAGRVFPWEYVIAAATRRHRRASAHHFTVMRQLAPHATQRSLWTPHDRPRSMLFVESAPGGLRGRWQFQDELERLKRALVGFTVTVLTDPTLQQLHDKVAELRPDMVHLSGFDNLQGLKALRELVPLKEPVEAEIGPMTLGDVLHDESSVPDGMLLAGEETGAALVGAQRLAEALSAGGRHCAYFVGVSLDNSAARTAALIVGERAALAAVGFQDAIENALVDFFFELVYTQLSAARWDAPLSFEQAWLRARIEPRATRATGITLWAGAPLLPRQLSHQTPKAAELRASHLTSCVCPRPN